MKDGYWAMRKYRAGRIGETVKYWVPGRKPTRSERRLKSDLRKLAANGRSAEKTVARLIHENFLPGKDMLVGLDYSPEGCEKKFGPAPDGDRGPEERDCVWAAARHQMELCIRRTARRCRQQGIPFRYIAFTSDMDGETGEAVRVHHHLIVNAEAVEVVRAAWRLGGVNWETLWGDDQSDLAAYLVRQVRQMQNAAKYIPSRNLRKPKPKDRIAVNGSEVRLPKGAQLLYRAPYRPGQAQYIRYLLPEEKRSSPQESCQSGGGGDGVSGAAFSDTTAPAPGGARARGKENRRLSSPEFVNFL